MARKSTSNGNGHTVSEDIVSIEREIGALMHDIEARVGKLQARAKRSAKEAANGATEFVSDTVSDAADGVQIQQLFEFHPVGKRARSGDHRVTQRDAAQ